MEFHQETSNPLELEKNEKDETNFEDISLSESDNSVMNYKNNLDNSSESKLSYFNSFQNSDTKLITETPNLKNSAPPIVRKSFSIIENESKLIR